MLKPKYIFILCFFLSYFSKAQKKDSWVAFYDTAVQSTGFKDLVGNIKIPAKFTNAWVDTFYNIVAVLEKVDSMYQNYYLLKNGKKVGIDSVFMFDYKFDCESEEKIIFQDKKSDRVGFLDKNGVVVIPAIYNIAAPFHNGLAIALKNAKRKCWGNDDDTLNCEHWGWVGGQTVLINSKNEILVDSLNNDLHNVNWYSLKICDANIDTTTYVSIKGSNGNVYSFLSYEKEFKKWFNSIFLVALKNANYLKIQDLLFQKITFWDSKKGWTNFDNFQFIESFPTVISKEKFEEKSLKKITISDGELNSYIFDDKLYKGFYNACGEHNKELFPLFEVMLTYYKSNTIDYQEHFEFLRTNGGYKLLSASWKQ